MKYDINRPPIAVILSDGIAMPVDSMTNSSATCMLSVGGSVILERTIRNCLSCGISQFVLVLGHGADEIKQYVNKAFRGVRVTYVINDRYHDANIGYALEMAASIIGSSEFVRLDADMVFDAKILRQLTDSDLPDVLCIDSNSALVGGKTKVIADDQMHLRAVGTSVDPKLATGVSIGIEKVSAATAPLLFAELALMMEKRAPQSGSLDAAYARMLDKGAAIHALDVTGLNWTRVDTAEGLATANALFRSPITTVSRGQQRALDEAAEREPHPT